MSSYRAVGRCSKCQGIVTVPTNVTAANQIVPVPTCISCGATKANKLPIIEMEGGGFIKQLLQE